MSLHLYTNCKKEAFFRMCSLAKLLNGFLEKFDVGGSTLKTVGRVYLIRVGPLCPMLHMKFDYKIIKSMKHYYDIK